MKSALIFGITGQDGSYLAEILLEKGYRVYGAVRRTSIPIHENIEHLIGKIHLLKCDITDPMSVHHAIVESDPDEIYNLAGMSQVLWSFSVPGMTMDVNFKGLQHIIDAVRSLDYPVKIYQASSSEMYGAVLQTPQTEATPFNPISPYAVSKVSAHYLAKAYRAMGMDIRCGILFNHESPRRGEEFVTRKICKEVVKIADGKSSKIFLGNLSAKRDWGYAPEFMEWVYAIMQHDVPDDFVIATGEMHSVEEFVAEAFKAVGISRWHEYVEENEEFMRPAEVHVLLGDASKSRRLLGFEPKVKFKQLVEIMMHEEMMKYFQTQKKSVSV